MDCLKLFHMKGRQMVRILFLTNNLHVVLGNVNTYKQTDMLSLHFDWDSEVFQTWGDIYCDFNDIHTYLGDVYCDIIDVHTYFTCWSAFGIIHYSQFYYMSSLFWLSFVILYTVWRQDNLISYVHLKPTVSAPYIISSQHFASIWSFLKPSSRPWSNLQKTVVKFYHWDPCHTLTIWPTYYKRIKCP